MEKDINYLIERVKSGQADSAETLAFLKTLNISFDVLKVLLEEIKVEQIRQDLITKNNL